MANDWTDRYEVQGEERAAALAEAAAIIAGWGLTMPPCEPMPLHFGLGDFRRIGETEYWIVNDTVNHYCGKFLFLFEDQRCPCHRHAMKDETFFVVRGAFEFEIDGVRSRLEQGQTLKLPPGHAHTFAAVDGPALVLEVSLPSIPGDNVFEDRSIGSDGVL